MLLSTRFFGGFTIPWGSWRNSTWLSSGRPWAIAWICKLVPPLRKHLFSSISFQLCITSYQKLCLHICFHGQKMLSYEYAYMCMQMRTAIIEKPNFVNIWKLCMIISWNWCLHICFHGQELSYYHLKCCSIICIYEPNSSKFLPVDHTGLWRTGDPFPSAQHQWHFLPPTPHTEQ